MHNKALRRVKLTANSIPAGDVILLQSVLLCPFFGLANFAGLFSFQLLTFVCRTPLIIVDGIWSLVSGFRFLIKKHLHIRHRSFLFLSIFILYYMVNHISSSILYKVNHIICALYIWLTPHSPYIIL